MSKLRKTFLSFAGVAALSATPTASFAHQEWVIPSFFVNDSEEESVWLGFEHALGDQRFAATLGPGPARISITGPNDEQASPSSVFAGRTRTIGEMKIEEPGTYRIVTVEADEYWTKLIEGDETKWVRGSRDRMGGKEIEVSRRYWTKSETYVSFRDQTRGPLAAEGGPLEIIPIDHPNAIVAGQPFQIELRANGAALSNGEVRVFADATEGHDPAMTVSTSADGRAQLRFPKAGRYLVRVYHQVEVENDPRADSYGYSVNLMIEAQDRP